MSNKHISHLKSKELNTDANGPKLPDASQIEYGELAINYLKGFETIAFKNSEDEIVTISNTTNLDNKINSHILDFNNPHKVTKEQIGLGNVNNTADLDKPLSNMAASELNKKINSGDVVDNLLTNDSSKPLSANQGKILKELIDSIEGGASGDITDLLARVSSLEEELDKGLTLADKVIQDSI